MDEEDLKCAFCHKIFTSEPITLSPCGWVVCSHHTSIATHFVCPICPAKHNISMNNCLKTKNIEIKYLKYKLADSLEKLDAKIEDINQIKKDPDHYINDFFGELINKIDIQRERVKLLVDNHFDGMLQMAKTSQSDCQNKVKNNKIFNEFDDKEFQEKLETIEKALLNSNQINLETLNNLKDSKAEIDSCISYIGEIKDSLTGSKKYELTPIAPIIQFNETFGKLVVSDKKYNEKKPSFKFAFERTTQLGSTSFGIDKDNIHDLFCQLYVIDDKFSAKGCWLIGKSDKTLFYVNSRIIGIANGEHMPILESKLANMRNILKTKFNAINDNLNSEVYYQPEQVHLSYEARPDQMIVTWVTLSPVNESVVEFGIEKINQRVNGTSKIFTDGGLKKRKMEIHKVLLENLIPGQTYKYHFGSKLGWSDIYSFTAMSDDTNWSPRFAIFGDMGNENAQSIPRLQEETMLGFYDAIFHVGDFAYDMSTDNALVGDAFMNQIQPIAAYIPYMTSPGNHESHTEFYYYVIYDFKQLSNQYKWLEEDLGVANLPENRAKRPWIITMGNRPMYCTNNNTDDCTKVDDTVRVGLPHIKKFGLEDLFYKNGVDIELWAHEHSYERLWPIYNFTVYNGNTEFPYTNPGAPIHKVTGSAGCREKHDDFGSLRDFCAFRANDYGYTRLQAFNSTHLYFEQVSDEQDGKVIESFWVIKKKHGMYTRIHNMYRIHNIIVYKLTIIIQNMYTSKYTALHDEDIGQNCNNFYLHTINILGASYDSNDAYILYN
ncbi:unnamed protein product [Brachionus calyciflorus]|uniref:Purple acid phosphatase n=1 Tax=Brachionus calyciflorus TaxID=104777 RepID=A0A813YVP6_9BILA|nr:unnamed protein product [Brachionus calyciflorus]